jgi:hypothetical protein
MELVLPTLWFEASHFYLDYFTENDLFVLPPIFWLKMPTSDC